MELDRDWVEAGARRTAYYSHLPPGSYTFTVTPQWGRRVERDGADARDRGPSALRSDLVVSGRGRVEPGGIGMGLLAVSGWPVETRADRATGVFAAVDRIAGARASADRRGVARQPWPEPARRQEPRDDGRAVTAGRGGAQAVHEIVATAAQTLEEVRAISYNLRPHHLDQLGLTTTIRAMIDKIAETSAIGAAASSMISTAFPARRRDYHLPDHPGEPQQRSQALPCELRAASPCIATSITSKSRFGTTARGLPRARQRLERPMAEASV